jgi:glycosyltransferase involved in cell wall biosynthesis
MRVALVLEAPHQVGGVFQHILASARQLQLLTQHEVFVLTPLRVNVERLRGAGVPCYLYRFGFLRRLLARGAARASPVMKLVHLLPKPMQRLFGAFDVELMVHRADLTFFFHSSLPLYVHHSAYVAIVYDLCHRDWPEFPEVSEQFESRERTFGGSLARAVAVIVSAPTLARDICRFYGVAEHRTLVLPFTPALHTREPAPSEQIARVREKYGLREDYVFYPAQFWPHKNHLYLLQGLKALEVRYDIRIHAVFSGSDFGNVHCVQSESNRLGLDGRVHFLGFVADEDMSPLYSGARALVMPTYFGPTNMPPLEAIAAGCPVVYSDLPEFREDLGGAALYCNLRDPASLAEQLRLILTRPDIVSALNRAGRELLSRLNSSAHVEKLKVLLDDFDYMRQRWAR